MRVLLATYGSRGDVEPMVALAVQLQALGVEARVYAPPDEEFAELLAGVGVPMVPFGKRWREWVRPSTADERTRRVAEKRAISHRYVIFAPSAPNDPDAQSWNALFGPPINSHRASIDLPLVDDVAQFMFTDHPWLAADPTVGLWQEATDVDVVQAGAWILPVERPTVAAKLLVDALRRERPPVSA
jgi:vancomycin aglycone glucosyltransferase